MSYDALRLWVYGATLAPFLLSWAFYGLRSPWWNSRVGKGLFILLASIVAVLTFAVFAIADVIPEPLKSILRIVLLGGVQIAGWIFLANILREQRRDKDAPHPRRRTTDAEHPGPS